jgi:hypothetical protein
MQAEKAKEYEVLISRKSQWQSVSEDQVGFLGPDPYAACCCLYAVRIPGYQRTNVR